MTRLADALQRATRRSDAPGGFPMASPVAVPPSDTPKFDQPVVAFGTRMLPKEGTSLLAPPSTIESDWRNDPELIGKLIGTETFPAGALEQYRKLAATLHRAQEEQHIQALMTASCLPGEGKSLTAVNLALTLSGSYQRRVILIDGDLRRPTIQRVFNLPTITGLDDGLKADRDRPMPLIQLTERLFVLPAGRPDPDPLSGLVSDRMLRLVQQARAAFDWVLIDTPPVTLLPDANLLAVSVDGVLLVVRTGKAPYHLVKRTAETLGHDRILGVVMNAVDYAHDRNAGGYYEYYGYGYGYGYYGAPKKK